VRGSGAKGCVRSVGLAGCREREEEADTETYNRIMDYRVLVITPNLFDKRIDLVRGMFVCHGAQQDHKLVVGVGGDGGIGWVKVVE
jgi:hypothetical protein